MKLTRRKFLSAMGAGALVAAAPPGLIAAGSEAASASLAGGIGEYAVVSQHATWGVYETMAHAHREAELIRHSGGILTNAVRCSPDMVRQYQLGKIGGFVEVDGWAVTQGEARRKGLDLLRRAGDRSTARQQLFDHQLAALKERLNAFDRAREDSVFYARSNDGGKFAGVFEKQEDVPDGMQASRCSLRMFEAIKHNLEGDGTAPAVSTHTDFHMLDEEHETRRVTDIVYRIATGGVDDRFDAAQLTGPTNARFVAVANEEHWIFGAGGSEEQALAVAAQVKPYFSEDFSVMPASQALARVVLENGYEVPAFWKTFNDTAHHEVELDSV